MLAINEQTEAIYTCFLEYLSLTGLVQSSYAVTKVDPKPGRLTGKQPEYTNTRRNVVPSGTVSKFEIPIWPTGIIFQEGEYLTLKVPGHYMILDTGWAKLASRPIRQSHILRPLLGD